MAVSTGSLADINLLRGAVSDILGAQGQAASDTAAATGQQYAQQGAAAEASAYQSAQQIAQQNAQLEQVSGQIQEAQTQREVAGTIGAQRAAFATAGFGKGGSALAALTASKRQGALAGQLIRTQTQLNQGGYLEQANAAGMEAQIGTIQGNAAAALGSAYTTAATQSQTQATNEAAALMGYLSSVGGTTTPAAQVVLSSLSAANVPGVPNTPVPTWQQVGGTWSYGGVGGGGGIGAGGVTFGPGGNRANVGAGNALFGPSASFGGAGGLG